MALQGYKRQAGRRDGGIVRIAVAEADAVENVVFDFMTGNATGLTLTEGETFALFEFREDTARLVETVETTAYFPIVRRELSFQLERLDENERQTVARLVKATGRGFVVLAMNGCGTVLLLGYNRKLGDSFPMQIRSAVADTGYAPQDAACETVIFYNEDAEKAPVYTGEFPAAAGDAASITAISADGKES